MDNEGQKKSHGFVEGMIHRLRDRPGRVAYPESDDPRILAAIPRVLDSGAVSQVLLWGDPEKIHNLARSQGLDLGSYDARIQWQPEGAPPAAGTEEETPLVDAARRLVAGEVDTVIAGAVYTTADVIRTGLRGVGVAPGIRTVSGSFMMNKPGEGLYLFADAGVVIAPTVEQLVDIASASVGTWQRLIPQREPAVAFLSFSTKGSAAHEHSAKMEEAAALFRERHPEIKSDGELQFDAAIDPTIGQRKSPGSPAAGRANCFVFPDLGAGNLAYKITQRLGGYEAYGPILQGLALPFSDLSRGSTVEDIVASTYVNLLRRNTP